MKEQGFAALRPRVLGALAVVGLALNGCAPPRCAQACAALTEGCTSAAFPDVGSCLEACSATEAANPAVVETLDCYTAAGCDLDAQVACARLEQSEALSP